MLYMAGVFESLSERYLAARDTYDELRAQTAEAKAAMDEAEQQLLAAMNDAELEMLRTSSGVSFSRQRKTSYSCLAENRADLLLRLEAEGYRDMFTISPQSLSALFKEKVAARDDGEIPPEYADIVSEHEEVKLSVRGRKK